MKIINSKRSYILFSIILVIVITFSTNYVTLIKEFESEAQAKAWQIDRYAELCSTFIDMMTIYGNDFFLQDTSVDSELFDLIEYNSSKDSYNLEAIKGTKQQKNTGNITGLGSIPKSGTRRDELNLALQYNQFFYSLYERIPDVAWLYYTSESNFLSIYPWISSEDFKFTEEIKTAEFYTSVIPENDPEREYRWTPVYLDYAGKGLMVSLSGPIYRKDTFVGVVSLDLANARISELMASKYEGYLIDSVDSIIAASNKILFDEELIKIDTLVENYTESMDEISTVNLNTAQKVGFYYIYTTAFEHAPWRFIFRVPIWSLLAQSAVTTIPIIIVGTLLLLALYESESRKKTLVLLNKSLNDLKSYQNKLENSAKFDYLTSSYNRRGLMEYFKENVAIRITTKSPISFLLGDIDFFKKLNDKYGHNAGDKVLVDLSNLIKNNIGETDVICRWGGEEFLIVLFDKSYEEALLVAEKIRLEIAAMIISWEESTEIMTTMTFGVAEYDYDEKLQTTVSKADKALYSGKENGRNRVVGFCEIPDGEINNSKPPN